MKKALVKVNMLNNQALNAKSTPHFKRHGINNEQVIPKSKKISTITKDKKEINNKQYIYII